MSNPTTASIKDQNKNEASSMFKRNVRKFMNNKLALFGLIVVVLSPSPASWALSWAWTTTPPCFPT